jgi:hypothetical protein
MLEELGKVLSLAFLAMMFSFQLYRENRFYRFAEYTALAASLGNGVVIAIEYIRKTFVTPSLQGGPGILYLLAVVFAFLLAANYSREYKWIARYPMAIIVGVGMAIALRTSLETEVAKQVWAAMTSIIGGPYTPLDNAVTSIITIIVIAYFLMIPKYTGRASYLLRIARYFMMIGFGATIGARVPSFLAWTSGRITYLLQALGLLGA